MIPIPLTILLVDDHEVVRRGTMALLASEPDWKVVGEAAEGRTAVKLAAEHQPSVVILDVRMPELNGFETARRIRQVSPKSEILIHSMHEGEQVVRETIDAGARGYVLKSDSGRDLIDAVKSLARHEPFFTSRTAERVFAEQRASGKVGRPFAFGLTPREREILQLLAEGFNNPEIADRLRLARKTVETHRARVMKKIGATSLADLVRYAVREAIIGP